MNYNIRKFNNFLIKLLNVFLKDGRLLIFPILTKKQPQALQETKTHSLFLRRGTSWKLQRATFPRQKKKGVLIASHLPPSSGALHFSNLLESHKTFSEVFLS